MTLKKRIKAIVVAFIVILMVTVCSQGVLDNEWDITTCTLSYSSPEIMIDSYKIKVVDFNGHGSAQFDLSRNGTFIESIVLRNNSVNWNTIDNGQVEIKGNRITDKDKLAGFGRWPDDPKAELIIKIKKQQTPDNILLEIDIDEDDYLLDETVTAKITVKNVGETDAHNIHLNVGANGLITRDKLEYEYDMIKDGSSRSKTLKFRFSRILSDNLSVFANVTWDEGKKDIGESEEIEIEPLLKITKSMTGYGNTSSVFFTTIGIANNQPRKIHIILADVIPKGFILINSSTTEDNHKMMWEFDINPDERKTFEYQLSTDQPASYRVPNPYAKCILGGRTFIITPDYSTVITVRQSSKEEEGE
ncbi:MAG: hypothetical protein ACNYWM_01735 [Methanosarcinales archaeon]